VTLPFHISAAANISSLPDDEELRRVHSRLTQEDPAGQRLDPLTGNVLLHLDEQTRSQILIKGKQRGQARVNELFRSVHGKKSAAA
jgi:hypothetical protein